MKDMKLKFLETQIKLLEAVNAVEAKASNIGIEIDDFLSPVTNVIHETFDVLIPNVSDDIYSYMDIFTPEEIMILDKEWESGLVREATFCGDEMTFLYANGEVKRYVHKERQDDES